MGCVEAEKSVSEPEIIENRYRSPFKEGTFVNVEPVSRDGKIFASQLMLDVERDKQFQCCSGQIQNSSSASIQFFLHKPTKTRWMGKCSYSAIFTQTSSYQPAPPCFMNEYKEALSLRLYSLFGVRTPQAVLSKQNLSVICQVNLKPIINGFIQHNQQLKGVLSMDIPRSHLMTRFIESFQVIGQEFFQAFQQKRQFCCGQTNKKIKGFGRVFAVATFLYDYDFVGKNGSNLGYLLENQEEPEIIKIDAGEALPFLNTMDTSSNMNHHPKTRDMILGTDGRRITFEDLNPSDKSEFILASHRILTIQDEELREVFQQFIELDSRFEAIFTELIERKINFLKAFSEEVRELLQQEIMKISNQTALAVYENWNNPVKPVHAYHKIVNQSALLESYQLNEDSSRYQLPKRNKFFVGRQKELILIEEILRKEKMVCICGTGGMGKTELVREYINTAKQRTKMWFHAQFGLAYSQIQTYMHTAHPHSKRVSQPEKLLQQFYLALDNDACLVFDNMENPDQLASLQPNQNRKERKFHVIITSRFSHWEIPMLKLSPFLLQTTNAYFSKLKYTNKVQSSQIEELHGLLEGLPIAISQALGYIRSKSISVADYCAKLRQDSSAIVSPFEGDNSITFTTFVLSLHSMKEKDYLTDEVMNIAAYLSPDHLTADLLEKYLERDLRNTIKVLVDYSIFYDHENRNLKIHRLTQNVCRLIHRKNNTFRNNFESAIRWIIDELYFDRNNMSRFLQASKMIPHGLALCSVEQISNSHWNQRALLFYKLGNCQLQNSNFRDAFQYYRTSLEICLKYEDMNSLHKSIINQKFGNLFEQSESYNVKMNCLKPFLNLPIQNDNVGNCLTAKLFNNIGKLYETVGSLQKYKLCLEISLQLLQNNPSSIPIMKGIALFNLGNYYGLTKCHKKQLLCLFQTLKIYESYYGQAHPETARILINIANTCEVLGLLEQKQKAIQRSEKIMTNLKDVDQFQYGFLYALLGEFYRKKNFLEVSCQYATKALRIFKSKFGPKNNFFINTLLSLSALHGDRHDYAKQRDLLEQVVRQGIGDICEKKGAESVSEDFAKLEFQVRISQRSRSSSFNKNDERELQTHREDTILILSNLTRAHLNLKDIQKSKEACLRILRILLKYVLTPKICSSKWFLERTQIFLHLVNLYAERGQLTFALRCARVVLEINRRASSEDEFHNQIEVKICRLIKKIQRIVANRQVINGVRRKSAFRYFQELPQKCQTLLHNKIRKSQKRWNRSSNMEKLYFLQKLHPNTVSSAFLNCKFWTYLCSKLAVKHSVAIKEKKEALKLAWIAKDPYEQIKFMSSFERQGQQPQIFIDLGALY